MKKILLIIAAFCFIVPNVSAQKKAKTAEWTVIEEGDDELGHYVTETTYEKGIVAASGIGKNWTLTAAIGAQFYIGDNDWKAKFGDWWAGPSVDLYATKWISPSFGLGIGFTYSPMVGLYQGQDDIAAFRTDEYYGVYNKIDMYRQKGQTFNPYVIALLDLDNLIAGFNPERIYNAVLYAGGGVIFGLDPVQARSGVSFNMGFMNIFKVHKSWDIVLNLRGSLVSDQFDGECRQTERQTASYIRDNVPFDGTFGITGGVTYHFGSKNKQWQNVGRVVKTYTGYADAKKEIKHLKDELDKAKAENEALLAKCKEKEVVKDPTLLWYHVQFIIDKWNITNRELVNLKAIADQIKAAPNTQFSICGYADMQTATPPHNLMLSKNRVNEVFKVLTEKFGVNPSQLERDYKGGVDLMFYQDNKLSRCVIIKTADGKPLEIK